MEKKHYNTERMTSMYNDTTRLKEILSNNVNLNEFILELIKNMIETLLKAELTEF